MRVLVTGGAGFIGANLCARLSRSDTVSGIRAIDDLSTGRRENLSAVDLNLVEASILDRDALRAAVDGVDAIVHLAARPSVARSVNDPEATHDANATGTVRVLETARGAGVSHIVVASSSSVYGANTALPKREDQATMPLSPYAASKLATEQYALSYQSVFDLRVLAFRFFNVFGPLQPAGHDYAAVVPAFVDAAVRGRPLTVHGDGKQTRDFTYVGTVVSVIEDALRRRVHHDMPVNLAFGTRRTINSVADAIEEHLGRGLEREYVSPRPGDVRHSQADDSRLRKLFPDVQATGFDEGLERTIDWFATANAS